MRTKDFFLKKIKNMNVEFILPLNQRKSFSTVAQVTDSQGMPIEFSMSVVLQPHLGKLRGLKLSTFTEKNGRI
jgi:hypothetical protein